ncbi:MAG: efflux RND transporter permease subunit [Nannocystaceae bacterium]
MSIARRIGRFGVAAAALVVLGAGCAATEGRGGAVVVPARRAQEIRALASGQRPELAAPVVEVEVAAPGFDPAAVEAAVTTPVEEALRSMAGLESLTSTSAEGIARVTARFAADVDPEVALLEVRRRVDALDELPSDAHRPVLRLQAGARAVALRYLLTSAELPPRDLQAFEEEALARPLRAARGVVERTRCGEREEAVVVTVDLARLVAMGVDLRAVEAALRGAEVGAAGDAVATLGELRLGDGGAQLRDAATIELREQPPECRAFAVGGGALVGEVRVQGPLSASASAIDAVFDAASAAAPPSVTIVRMRPSDTLEFPLRVPVGGEDGAEDRSAEALATAVARAMADLRREPWALELGRGSGEGRLLVRGDAAAKDGILAALRTIPGVDARPPVGEGGGPVTVTVRGEDLEAMRGVSLALVDALRRTPGVAEAILVDDAARPELAVRVDAAQAAALGVRAEDVSRVVTAALSGIDLGAGPGLGAGSGPRRILRVRAANGDAADDRLARLQDAVVALPSGGVAPLTAVATVAMARSSGPIRRSDGRRSQTLELTLEEGGDARAVGAAIKATIAEQELPPGVSVELPPRAPWWSR